MGNECATLNSLIMSLEGLGPSIDVFVLNTMWTTSHGNHLSQIVANTSYTCVQFLMRHFLYTGFRHFARFCCFCELCKFSVHVALLHPRWYRHCHVFFKGLWPVNSKATSTYATLVHAFVDYPRVDHQSRTSTVTLVL